MREFLDLANNPLFVKHVRSRLRRSSVMPGIIIVICLSLCIIWINSIAKGPNNPPSNGASQMFFWLQGVLLVLLGGSQVASAIAQMKESGMIDFHRITPIPAPVQTIGVMIGAPIRELILYAITLPFALYLAIDGPVGVTNFAKLLLVQLGGALMYYSLAMITGLMGGRSRGASGRYVAILAGLNIMANIFPLEIYGPTLVTSIPVYYEVFYEDENAPAQQQMQPMQQQQQQQRQVGRGNQPPPNQPPLFQRKHSPTFFGLPLPLVVQSLMFQGGLLTFLFIGASRRIHSARVPLYTKPVALLFLGTLSFLTLGSLWDSPTLPLTLGSVYFLTFCSILLTNSVTPALGDVVKGMQRARKLSGLRIPLWSDLASNKFVVVFFACTVAATISIGLLLAPQPPMRFINPREVFSPWPSLLVGVLTILMYGFVSQFLALAFGKRARSYFILYLFFAWFAPIVVGMIILLAEVKDGGYLLAVSPIIGIAFAGAFGIPELNQVAVLIASIGPGALCSIFFGALLIHQEHKLLGEVADEPTGPRRRKQDRSEVLDVED